MRPGLVKALAAGAAGAAIIGGTTVAAVSGVVAYETLVPRGSAVVNTKTTVDAPPEVVSEILNDPSFVCDLMLGCDSATKSGSKTTAVLDLPGIGDQKVAIKVEKQVPGESVKFEYSAKSNLGSASSTATITLKPKSGGKTEVIYRTTALKSSGVLGKAMTVNAAGAIRNGIAKASIAYKDLKADQYPMGVKVPKLPKKLKAGKKVKLKPTYWITTPLSPAPVAHGTTKILINGKRACVIKVKNSAGTCKAKIPNTKKVKVEAVFAGEFNNGMKMFASAKTTKKVSR